MNIIFFCFFAVQDVHLSTPSHHYLLKIKLVDGRSSKIK